MSEKLRKGHSKYALNWLLTNFSKLRSKLGIVSEHLNICISLITKKMALYVG